MNRFITVTLVDVTVTGDDGLGNTTETTTTTDYPNVRFAPRSSTERTDPRQPAVVTGAQLVRRGEFPADAADRIVITDQHPQIDGTWQVEGEVGRWASGVEVAIQRVG